MERAPRADGATLVRVLIDSNVLVDYLRGVPQARGTLAQHPNAAISLLNWIEVMVGVREPAHVAPTRAFLARFEVIAPDAKIAELAVQLRQLRPRLRLPDALVWATARARGLTLLTRDAGDFPAGEDDVIAPYMLDRVHEPAAEYRP